MSCGGVFCVFFSKPCSKRSPDERREIQDFLLVVPACRFALRATCCLVQIDFRDPKIAPDNYFIWSIDYIPEFRLYSSHPAPSYEGV
jgi:hypothetical protein